MTTEWTRKEQLMQCITKLYSDAIGCNENAYMDGERYTAYTPETLADEITNTITQENGFLEMEDFTAMVEAKHFRFMTKEEIHEIVTLYIAVRRSMDGKWEWEKEA